MHQFWADELADRVTARHGEPFVVSDWKTPSGRITVGHLRGVVLHDAVARALRHQGKETRYIYGFDDMDPFTKVPSYLDQAGYQPYLGLSLTSVPVPNETGSPDGQPVTPNNNYARFFASEFENVYRKLGVESETLSTTKLYQEGFFDEAIQITLDHADVVRAAYEEVLTQDQSEDRRNKEVVEAFPLNVRCESCQRIVTTEVTAWDGTRVSYRCPTDRRIAAYVDGCGHTGTVSPFTGAAKLPWKIEWAAKWWLFKTDIEGAGKDHYTKGGSRDVASELFRRLFAPRAQSGYDTLPEDLFYEWLYLGGKKMSTSKGVGVYAKDILDLAPAELLRFFMVRVKPKTGVDFDPTLELVSQLYDEYDRCVADAKSEPQGTSAAILRAGSLTAIEPGYRMRFRALVPLLQLLRPNDDHILIAAEKEKGSALSDAEQTDLERRIAYAKRFVEKVEDRIVVQETMPTVNLTDAQRQFLAVFAEKLKGIEWEASLIQELLRTAVGEVGLPAKEGFQAIYQSFLARDHGPQAGQLLAGLEKEFVLARLKKAAA